MSDSLFQSLLKNFSQKGRSNNIALLESVFDPRPDNRVLDIGASGEVF